MSSSPQEMPWARLVHWAEAEVQATLERLPRRLRESACLLPVTYEPVPGSGLLEEGIEPDTLGLFVGPTYAEEPIAHAHVPAQIILFLRNIWEMTSPDITEFRAEIRTTFLHELGHYLGLDEDELEDRGLE